MSSKTLIRKITYLHILGATRNQELGREHPTAWERTPREVLVVAAFLGKRKQTESLAHSKGWEEVRTQEPVGPKVVLGLPSRRATWTCPRRVRQGSRVFRIQTLVTAPHIPYKCCASESGMMEGLRGRRPWNFQRSSERVESLDIGEEKSWRRWPRGCPAQRIRFSVACCWGKAPKI